MNRVRARRILIEIARRRHPVGAGSDISFLRSLPANERRVEETSALAGFSYVIVGGIATRAYMPERFTKDVDVLVATHDDAAVTARLKLAGWSGPRPLVFPHSALGLFGSAWRRDSSELVVLSAAKPWVNEALSCSSTPENPARVVALPYLVLMKLDSSRAQDSADISRMLAVASEDALASTRDVVARYAPDPEAVADLESLREIGRWEAGLAYIGRGSTFSAERARAIRAPHLA